MRRQKRRADGLTADMVRDRLVVHRFRERRRLAVESICKLRAVAAQARPPGRGDGLTRLHHNAKFAKVVSSCRARRGHGQVVGGVCIANGRHAHQHGLPALDNVPLALFPCVMGPSAMEQRASIGPLLMANPLAQRCEWLEAAWR
jgi:hypothetical protein